MGADFYAAQAKLLSQRPRPLPLISGLWEKGDPGFPIAVSITAGDKFARTSWPVAIALSLPPGALPSEAFTLSIWQAGNVLPSQTEVFTRWPDGSAQHVRLHTLSDIDKAASLEIKGTREVRLPGLQLAETEDAVEIDTGAAVFRIEKSGPRQIVSARRSGREFVAEGGEVSCWAGVILDAITGNRRNPGQSYHWNTKVAERGEARLVVLKEARTWQDGEEVLMVTEFVFYKNQPWVRLYTWCEREDYRHHPMVECETAFHGDFIYEGSQTYSQSSRFGEMSESEVVPAAKLGGVTAKVVLPWLRELGISSPTNVTRSGGNGRMVVEWHPIRTTRAGHSPMNSPCWVARYWREAALVLEDDAGEPGLAEAVRRELEFHGPEVRLPGLPDPDLALQELLIIPRECEAEIASLAQGQAAVRVSGEYPADGIDGQEWHNWESAYFRGFAWRGVSAQQPKAFGPRAMKCDGLRLLQFEHAGGRGQYGRLVRLQARAWPVNLAPERMKWGFGFCDIGYYGAQQPRGQYAPEIANFAPSATNIAYAGRLLFHLFEMWCRTGERMLKEGFERLYRKVFEMFSEKNYTFDGDRVWIVIRDLARLYQFTENPRFLVDLKKFLALIPEAMIPEQWNGNYQCRLWNNETYALVFRLLNEDRMRRFHEEQLRAYLVDARDFATDETLLLPMVNTLPKDLRWGLLAAQLMTGFAAQAAWDETEEADLWYRHFQNVTREHLLARSPFWHGLHYRIYPESVYHSQSWRDRQSFADTPSGRGMGWDTDGLDANHAPGELFRAITLRAAAEVPCRVNLTRREIVFLIDPKRAPCAVSWPGGSLRCAFGGACIEIEVSLAAGTCALLIAGEHRLLYPDDEGIECLNADGWSIFRISKSGVFKGTSAPFQMQAVR